MQSSIAVYEYVLRAAAMPSESQAANKTRNFPGILPLPVVPFHTPPPFFFSVSFPYNATIPQLTPSHAF